MRHVYIDCEGGILSTDDIISNLVCDGCGVRWEYLGEYNLGTPLIKEIYVKHFNNSLNDDKYVTYQDLIYYIVDELDYLQSKMPIYGPMGKID